MAANTKNCVISGCKCQVGVAGIGKLFARFCRDCDVNLMEYSDFCIIHAEAAGVFADKCVGRSIPEDRIDISSKKRRSLHARNMLNLILHYCACHVLKDASIVSNIGEILEIERKFDLDFLSMYDSEGALKHHWVGSGLRLFNALEPNVLSLDEVSISSILDRFLSYMKKTVAVLDAAYTEIGVFV
jgi:hypothetical protein